MGKDMWEIYLLLLLFTVYCLIFLGRVFRGRKQIPGGKKRILILLMHNCGKCAEKIMWDILRLKSWHEWDFNLIVIDDQSQDDTLLMLNAFRKKAPFCLLPTILGKKIAAILLWQGKHVYILPIGAGASPQEVRSKLLAWLNQDYFHHGGNLGGKKRKTS
jgi:hypothetical protein